MIALFIIIFFSATIEIFFYSTKVKSSTICRPYTFSKKKEEKEKEYSQNIPERSGAG